MIAAFEDFCLWVYVLIDAFWQQLPPADTPSRGPAPGCSDSELLAMALAGECRGRQREAELVACWREYRQRIPVAPREGARCRLARTIL